MTDARHLPYTTLFRSVPAGRDDLSARLSDVIARLHAGSATVTHLGVSRPTPAPRLPQAYAEALAAHRLGPATNTGDRKSTRLNSSHVSISYAVCCLKK